MRPAWILTVVLWSLASVAAPLAAAPPWASLIPFKRVETDPRKSYVLTEDRGPWLILAASFGGGAEQQAHELVMELRSRFKLPAYVHKQTYDYTDTVEGLTIDKYGQRKRMRYANNAARYDAIAVLVGNFDAIDDPQLEKTLREIKYMRPDCLDIEKRADSRQRFIGWRELQRRMNLNPEKRNKGPMGNAFATRNPLLPDYFVAGGVDDFVEQLNASVEYSLLKNPGRYTVRVATFRGNDTTNADEIEQIERSGKLTNKLEIAADKAHRVTLALRRQGHEAYEFHGRYESIVTIGSFATDGSELGDGRVEIHPTIYRIMQYFGARRKPLPGQAVYGLQPYIVEGIPLDVQPLPIPVPRRSIGADYARARTALR